LATHYCHNGQTYSCGNQPYNPSTQFCYNSIKVGQKCGARTETYDPDLYQCKPQINSNGIYLKTPVSYGSESYEAVLIGTQTWMAKNLNYKTSDGASRCFPTSGTANASDADNSNCNIYCRLYTWSTAMGLDLSCNTTACLGEIQAKHKGVCPSGWHIPSDGEWDVIVNYAGGISTAGTKLKATNGWSSSGNGTDDYGFSALPGGRGNSNGTFSAVGNVGRWLSTTEYNIIRAYYRHMLYGYSSVNWDSYIKSDLLSVRCVKD
jgi:uncharacterized protein (TIGR02145 family)